MSTLNPEYAKFEKEIIALIAKINSQLKQLTLTDVEIAKLAAEIDFFKELKAQGFEKIVNQYFDNYDKALVEILKLANARGVDFASVNTNALLQIKELDQEYLLRSAYAWSSRYESELFKSIISGNSFSETIQNLEGIPLTDAQLGTVLNTSYSDFKRISTVETYKDKPEQKFMYVGGVIPTSSDECRWLMENQLTGGYTMQQIKAGIQTPFVHRYDDSQGQFSKGDPKIINEFGRQPNFNCIHEWQAI